MACGVGGLKLLKLQRAGKSAQAADAFLRGFALRGRHGAGAARRRAAADLTSVPRYKLTIEYDGAPFVGWQRQDNGPSIQAALEDAVFAFCGERVAVHGAGRTDAGVHALGQVAHFDLAEEKPAETVRGGAQLPSQAQSDRRRSRPRSCRTTSMRASRRPGGAIATGS